MGRILSKSLGAFIELGFRRLVAIAVLAFGTVPVLYGVCPQYWSARPSFATQIAADATPDLTPKADFAAAASEAAEAAPASADVENDAPVVRRLYAYSVVPGGVHSEAELRAAVNTDSAVRLHYAGLNLASARLERLGEPKLAYVSYRRGDSIFWTRNAVRIAKGERVMTDGTMMLRARCGNRISEVPMAPVEAPAAAVPPEAMELPPADAMAFPAAMPENVPLAPTPETAILIPPAGATPGSPVVPGGYPPPFTWIPTGGSPSSSGPTKPGSPGGPGGPSGPGAPSGPGSPSGPGAPGGSTPPPVITPPSGPGLPSGPGAPTPPISTPEPGEIAMLVAGIAAVAAGCLLRKQRAV
jgi:hypothetical protein